MKMFPATMFNIKIKLSAATLKPKSSCLFRSCGEVNGSGNITDEKNNSVGLRTAMNKVFIDKFPKLKIVMAV